MGKILVVDDDKIMLMMARRILATKHEVICAKSGAEAIELFEKNRPDLILSDLMMPEMDGYELHRALQEKYSELVPTIFMTADESDESESKGFEVGATDYIRKPLKADLLLRRVGKVLEDAKKLQGWKNAASTDPMTGFLNKSHAQNEIDLLAKKSAGVLLMMDLDSFKLVNDIHGHGMGDKILIRFSEIIKNIIRETDLVGRMGGDEFIAYLLNIEDKNILQKKADYLNEEIVKAAKNFMGENCNIPLGVSVGAVFAPEEGTDFSILYKKADSALYDIKQRGKHGLAIYGATHHEENFPIDNSNMQMILGERNNSAGAYFLDFENFKIIYRFMARMADVYKKNFHLLELDVPENISADDFKEKILHKLRRSDCVCFYNKKFWILLPETSDEDMEKIKNRLI